MPFPNEHACRLQDPHKGYKKWASMDLKARGKPYRVILGILMKDGKQVSEQQSLRYPKGSWSAADAAAHCKGKGGKFEAASASYADPEEYPLD